VRSVVLDTGPCLNFLSIDQGNLLHEILSADPTRLLLPREVVQEIEDKAAEAAKFRRAGVVLPALIREGKFTVLESDWENDSTLVKAIKNVSPMPPAQLLQRRRKDLGETMVLAHAVMLRAQGDDVDVVIDDKEGRARAQTCGFSRPISTVRVLATGGSRGLVTYAEVKRIYERLRPSDGSEPMDDGLMHWSDTPLSKREIYRTAPRVAE
jgi:predicted nucleic acid-binding protein